MPCPCEPRLALDFLSAQCLRGQFPPCWLISSVVKKSNHHPAQPSPPQALVPAQSPARKDDSPIRRPANPEFGTDGKLYRKPPPPDGRLSPQGANSSGSAGPNSVTVAAPTAAAMCIAPLSGPNTISERRYKRRQLPHVRRFSQNSGVSFHLRRDVHGRSPLPPPCPSRQSQPHIPAPPYQPRSPTSRWSITCSARPNPDGCKSPASPSRSSSRLSFWSMNSRSSSRSG